MHARLLATMILVTACCPAAAQLVLPGAVPPTPAGTREHHGSGGGGSSTGTPKPAALRPPAGVDALIGKPVWLNGDTGQMTLGRHDKDLVATELRLTGELISKPGEDCRIDIKPAEPIAAKPLGSPAGLLRYQLDLPTCPISFDVLDGAVLVGKDAPACRFVAADCQVNPGGLWGPPGASLGPDQVKALERDRTSAENAVRDNYRALVGRTKDRAAVKQIAADQAGFSSQREEICRSYVKESVHGFCAARFTAARATALQLLIGEAPPPKKRLSSKKRVVE